MPRFSYSRWDGTQVGFDFGADDVFEELTDELLQHGDVNQALRRLLQRGFTDRNNERIAGMRELLERLRERRQELLDTHDLGGAYEDIARRLREVVDEERAGIDQLEQAARDSGDQRRQEVASQAAMERRMHLDLLPPDLAGQVRSLQEYDWTNSQAQQHFEELMDELRKEMLQSQFNQMSEAMSDVSPEAMQRTKDMFNDLNAMLEAREAGRDTDRMFAEFMDSYGDMFPGEPQTLDELLEQMAQQMAAMSQMLASMSPEQRAQLQALSDALMEDMDLRWQVDRLGANLRNAFPQMGWDRGRGFQGQDPLGFSQAASMMNELGDLDALENLLSQAANPGALADVDIDRARQLLGPDAARSLEQLARMTKQLTEAGLIDQREGRLELTPRGLRQIGRNALADLFSRLVKDRMGRHSVERIGIGHERTYETKPYEWGDPFNLSIERTVRNAVGRSGSGTPVRLQPDDFEVERTETLTRTSTVLLVDLSLSMPMRDNFLAAKKTAMALHSLITTQYPRDYLGLIGFGELARELRPQDLPEVSWDYTYGTNMQHALVLARRLLARQTGTKQVIMITDGEPTAHLLEDGSPFFSYPPAPETVQLTLEEVVRCTKERITINTFMLDATGYLRAFVEKMTQLNRGRAFFTTPETLGDYVLVDFLDQKRTQRGGGARRRSA
ncbi:VWA domain-containing protein [Acidiferrimicrobium sp. IK]|uniref:VWA domain-containing protein n=1 Tax=Acidiferrimicrobium sp. IK TaxID=2871700 RepID=UPI0021CB6FD9|nr:VWA domain-containing protein [Acidiferrimicrobium sp. IK]MCU4185079.1 VWA domain-containing protein [Acidiferrimicrobium sp. IK]